MIVPGTPDRSDKWTRPAYVHRRVLLFMLAEFNLTRPSRSSYAVGTSTNPRSKAFDELLARVEWQVYREMILQQA